jgi:hypothetical protein
LGSILEDTANALKGEPEELCKHSWHDLAVKANKLQAQINIAVETLKVLSNAGLSIAGEALNQINKLKGE